MPTGATEDTTVPKQPSPEVADNTSSALQKLMETREFAWFSSHVFTLFFFLLYFLGRPVKLVPVFYRLGFFSAIIGFGIILRQQIATKKPSVQTLIANDSVHYITLASYLLVSQRQWALTIPFSIYSLFHALTYARSYLLPALGHDSQSSIVKAVDSFIQSYNQPFTSWAANFEFASLITHILYVFRARTKSSLVSALVYFAFFRVRYAASSYTRASVHSAEVFIDGLCETFQVSQGVKDAVIKFKALVAAIPGPTIPATKAD